RHLEAGIDLDGLLSATILEAIFDPHTPTHDGAVIIEGSRITKFSTHLPLSSNIEEIGRFGTRHAAALGISERTDSLCIVVSEEKSTVSVAWEGRLSVLKDPGELFDILAKFYQKNFPKLDRPLFLDFITGHSLEKVLAIILALTVWYIFGHRVETVVRDFVIPVEYRNLSSERIIAEPKPRQINVSISGTERNFRLLKPEDLKLSLDMSMIKDGKIAFTLHKEMLKLPKGLSVVNFEPENLEFSVYRLISQEFPVNVVTKGKLPSEIKSIKINIHPEKINLLIPNILDPKSIEVKTEPIDLSLIKENIELSLRLIIPQEARFLEERFSEAKVSIEVEKK
ncbi:MAG: diadenylate cyclase, partial [Candidatus Omnitrophica bacterium]|nr:diadenylate cyclase [Candidatus Omnitrophota bacterium]